MSRKKRWILFCLLVLLSAGAVGYIVYYSVSTRQKEEIYHQLQTEINLPQESISSAPGEEQTTADIPVDFEALWAVNSDIYAWIEIPGTQVNYPLVRHPSDDDYYLDHTIEGAEGYPGALYTQRCDAADFSDFNTVIYGHNMKDGSMFGSLKEYRDPEYLSEHREILIYTPEKKLTYQVFAAVVYDDRYIPYYYDDEIPEDRLEFLDSLSDTRNLNSQVLDDLPVDENSRILTLSTCIGGQPDQRYLIEAVCVDET